MERGRGGGGGGRGEGSVVCSVSGVCLYLCVFVCIFANMGTEITEQNMKKIVFCSTSQTFFIESPTQKRAISHNHITVLCFLSEKKEYFAIFKYPQQTMEHKCFGEYPPFPLYVFPAVSKLTITSDWRLSLIIKDKICGC